MGSKNFKVWNVIRAKARNMIRTNQGSQICKFSRRFRKSNFCGRWSQSGGQQAHDIGAHILKISRIFNMAFVPDVRIPKSKFYIFQRLLSVFGKSSNYMFLQFCTHFDLWNPALRSFLARATGFWQCSKPRKTAKMFRFQIFTNFDKNELWTRRTHQNDGKE